MSGAVGDRATAIFFALSAVAPDERAAFLSEQCGADTALREQVERLLADLDAPDPVSPRRTTDPATDGLAQPAGATIGDFLIMGQLGAGGTGVVHLAQQRHPPRTVALKMLRGEFLQSSVRRRFEIEAELLAHLHHPGIAEIYTAHTGDETTPPFIAMELVDGPSLTEFADRRSLPIRDRVELVARVCDAVQHAHQRGIIHRDLKPGNILVGEDGQPKILDFGVARRLEQASPATMATETGQLVGTLAYMSPEQVRAVPDAIDTRTDIYSLGVILFRLLAGNLPFADDDPPLPELARRIVQDDPPRLGTIDPSLKGDLEIIAARALAKDKDRRYAAAAGLAADLRRYLDGQPIAASADSAWYVMRRQMARYRLAFGVSAAAVLTVSALAVYASIQRARADTLNVRLQDELASSTIERGRLLSLGGNLPVAESLVWRELFRRPDSRHARWGLWEIYAKEPALWTRIVHQDGTQAVRFSPDGRLLVTAGRLDGSLRLLDAESGRELRAFARTPTSGLRRALFTPDGTAIVAGSEDGAVRVWDVESGALRLEIPRTTNRLHDFALAADGTTVATVAWGRAELWSLGTRRRLTDLQDLGDVVSAVAAGPAGSIVVFGGDDGVVTAMDVSRRVRLWRVKGHAGQVASLAVSPDGVTVASGGSEGAISLWHATSGERVRAIGSANGRVRSLSFDDTGRLLAAAGEWKTRVWDLTRPGDAPRDVGGAEGTTEARLRPDGSALATCNGGNGLVRVWHLAADARTNYWDTRIGGITGFDVTAATGELLVSGNRGVVMSWRADRPDLQPVLQSTSSVSGFDLSGNDRWLVTAGTPGAAAVWDMRDGGQVFRLPEIGSSRAVLFADNDRRIAAGDGEGTVTIWDWSEAGATNLRRIPSTMQRILALATWERRLFVGHGDRTIVVRDLADGAEISRFVASAAVFSLAVAPDGGRLAAGTYAGDVEIWDLNTGRSLHRLKGPTALSGSLAFSPDGSLLAVSSRDGATRLWDSSNGQLLARVAERRAGAERVHFLPDGRRLAIGYADGVIEIRDLDYYFRYAAGNAEYQLGLLGEAGETFPRAGEVLDWSRQILAPR